MKPILETSRLQLRKFTMDDLDALAPIMASPVFMRFSYRGPQSRDDTEQMLVRFLKRYERDGTGPYAMILKTSNLLIGFAGLPVQEVEGVRETEVGYGLHPDHWGQGFATEATIGCRDYAFGELGLRRLVSIINGINEPSIRVAEAMGMHHEKDFKFWGNWMRLYSVERPFE